MRHDMLIGKVGAFVFAVAALVGVDNAMSQRPQMQGMVFHGSGKITALAQGVLQVAGENGEQWFVRLDPQFGTTVYRATTTIGAIQQGMLVRLSNTFDAQGHATQPEDELEVITPNEMTRLGAFRDGEPGLDAAPGEHAAKGTVAAKGADVAKGTVATKGAEKRKSVKAPAKKKGKDLVTADAATGDSYTVVGRAVSLEDHVLTLAAERVNFQIQVQPEAQVRIEMADCSPTRAGDSVTVDGFVSPAAPGQVLARRIEITAAKPLEAPAIEQRRTKTTRKSRTK